MTTSNKHTFFKDLSKYETSDLFLTDRTDQLHKETYHNFIAISLTTELARQTSTDEIVDFVSKIKKNRQQQLVNSDLLIDLLYYLWFDEMEAQLRINFINANHEKLPFDGEMCFVESEQEVIYRFLTSPYLDGLLLSEQNKKESQSGITDDESQIWVYRERIVNKV